MCHCSSTKTGAPQNSDFRLIWTQTVCPRQQFAIEYLRVRMSRSKDFMSYYDYEARIVSEYSTNVFLQHKMHSTRTQEKGSRVGCAASSTQELKSSEFFILGAGLFSMLTRRTTCMKRTHEPHLGAAGQKGQVAVWTCVAPAATDTQMKS